MTVRDISGLLSLIAAILLPAHDAAAWDYEGHYVINQLALASLPTNFPAFVFTPAARERIAFLSGEADRWRNVSDLSLKQDNAPDHYIDLEELNRYGMTPDTLPPLRYDFVGQLAVFRAAHADKFPPADPVRDAAHTANLVGFLPWTITEYSGRLKSAFSYLKAYERAGGSSSEIANAQANIIYLMGVMGHFVGDGSQPLHTTIHFNGWAGSNPHGYTTNHTFHAWIDGGYFRKTGGLKVESMVGKIRPAEHVGTLVQTNGIFHVVVDYLAEQNTLVEPLYQLEKDGKISGEAKAAWQERHFLKRNWSKAAKCWGISG